MDYHLLGEKYRILCQAYFCGHDWALRHYYCRRIGLGFALGATAALIYMPFAQRILMKMISQRA